MGANDYVEIKIPARADYVGVVRLTVSGIANRMGFDYEAIEDLKIAVSEAITNAVCYAYLGEGEITIGFGIYDDRLEVMVLDHGNSFNFNEIKNDLGPFRPSDSIDELREGGFGLFLIQALMDNVEINNDQGVTVFMTKYLEENGVGLGDQISGIQEREG